MMKSSRRNFLVSALSGGVAATLPSFARAAVRKPASRLRPEELEARYAKLDEALKQPVFKRELFPAPVIIETLELLHYKGSYLCRVRSKDGAEGISISNSTQMSVLYPIFVKRMQPFFIGKDARDIEALVE